MVERDLLNALNDCIDRLNSGATLEACLSVYPQYRAELQNLLLAGQAVRELQIDPREVQAAQANGRARLRAALEQAPPAPRRTLNLLPLLRLAAMLTLVLGVFLGGAGLAAETSLPGDPLYGVKRLSEAVRLNLPGAPDDLPEYFAQRRRDEIRQLLAINRAESVDFTGTVESIDAAQWQVAGLALLVPEGTPGAQGVLTGDVVAVQANTTTAGTLLAAQITRLESDSPRPTPTLTQVPTQEPTLTLTLTMTASPTLTASPTASGTPTPTLTPTLPPTAQPTSTPPPPTATTISSPIPAAGAPGECVPTAPEGWIRYQVRAGDALSSLAIQTGITLDELMAVNCLTNPRLIVIGQTLWLPMMPIPLLPPPSTGSLDSGGSSGGGSSGSSGSGGSGGSSGSSGSGGSSGSSSSGSSSNDDDDDDDADDDDD